MKQVSAFFTIALLPLMINCKSGIEEKIAALVTPVFFVFAL